MENKFDGLSVAQIVPPVVTNGNDFEENITTAPVEVNEDSDNGLVFEVNGKVEEEVKMKDMDDAELMSILRKNLPEDMQELSDEEINAMIENGLKQENPTATREEQLKKCFGDRYQEVFDVVSDHIYDLSEGIDEDNARSAFLDSVSNIINLIRSYEINDSENTPTIPGIVDDAEKLKYKDRCLTMLRAALKHFVVFLCNVGNGSLASHDKKEIINGIIWDNYSDTLQVQHLITNLKHQFENLVNPESRYLDTIITNGNSVGHILASVAWLINESVDILVAEKLEKDVDATLEDRNDTFIELFRSVL